ncbi:hypothetical protein [Corallococcus sp. Z5C101001]|uniref:hypothetical protein n=1 Tax=Corallococcus sp. Z5C101001 TaxID=2596829 RepID=UPI00117C1357|nr:hypothetical protein [Corallococcus sp. Z5C101001]TSC34243.1 hypothetical protein FOF48_04195 [Corallococcus sp. Z5C101001]
MREASEIPDTEAPSFSTEIEIDGLCFRVHLGGPTGPLELETTAGEHFRLRPWGFDAHLRALDQHTRVDAAGRTFDSEGFARDVLRDSGVPESKFDELAPLALWWASGGARSGPVPARLRPWTYSERSRALEESVVSRPDGTRELSLDRYLRAMLQASVVTLEPPGATLSALDGPSTAALLEEVVALNQGGERVEDQTVKSAGREARALAQITLRLCKALGWTPSQVWATPAAEVDRLLALLQLTEPPTPAPAPAPVSRRPRLSDFPDAVVIQVEDR